MNKATIRFNILETVYLSPDGTISKNNLTKDAKSSTYSTRKVQIEALVDAEYLNCVKVAAAGKGPPSVFLSITVDGFDAYEKCRDLSSDYHKEFNELLHVEAD